MKTYVLDTSGLFALLEHKPGAPKIKELLQDATRGHCRILMSSIHYGEVYGLLLRRRSEAEAAKVMNALSPLPIALQSADAQRCFRAAEVKITHKLYYVDAFAAALAIENKATLVTCDSDFRRLGHSFPILWLKP